MKRLLVLLGVLAGLGGAGARAAERPEPTQAELDAIEGIYSAIRHQDCKLVATRLNDGLRTDYAGLFLLAGSLFEDGVCLKANWDKAQAMYQRAAALGHQGGRYRLIAGLAHGGRDPAAAVWWSQERQAVNLPGPCKVAEWVHQDAEAYVATLRAWPDGQLAACAYVAGVAAMIAGDAEYPVAATRSGLAGTIEMVFLPSQGRVDWRTVEAANNEPVGFVAEAELRDRASRKSRDALRVEMQRVSDLALARFARPPGIDAEWVLKTQYVFSVVLR